MNATIGFLLVPKLVTLLVSAFTRRRFTSLKQLMLYSDDSGFFGKYIDINDAVPGKYVLTGEEDRDESDKIEGLEEPKKESNMNPVSGIYDKRRLESLSLMDSFFTEDVSRDWLLFGE